MTAFLYWGLTVKIHLFLWNVFTANTSCSHRQREATSTWHLDWKDWKTYSQAQTVSALRYENHSLPYLDLLLDRVGNKCLSVCRFWLKGFQFFCQDCADTDIPFPNFSLLFLETKCFQSVRLWMTLKKCYIIHQQSNFIVLDLVDELISLAVFPQ